MKIDEANGDNNCNCSCGSLSIDSDRYQSKDNCKDRRYTWLDANGRVLSRKLTDYECNLEDEVQKLQDALFSISSHYAKIQFRLRQIACSTGNERLCLLRELQRITCQGIDGSRENDELPTLMSDAYSMGDVRVRQKKIITQLRSRLTDLAEVADSGFSYESESSYNLRKNVRADGTALSEITSDGKVEHGKYCACIICQENREEFTRISAAKRGYLSETWPQLGSDYEWCECENKGRTKSKKHSNKRKAKKLDKIAKRKSPRRGSLNRYYYRESPNQGNQQAAFNQASTRAQVITPNSQLGKVSSGKRSSAHASLNGSPKSKNSPSQKGLQATSNASIRGRKSPSPSMEKSLNRSSRQESFTKTNSIKRSNTKRSLESFTSSPSGAKSLGRKKPELSITDRRRIQEGLPNANLKLSGRRSSSEQPPYQDSRRQSESDTKSLNNIDSSLGLQTQDNVKRSSKASESFFSKLSNKWSKKSNKRASIDENDPIYKKELDDQNKNRDQSRSYREDIKNDNQYDNKRDIKSMKNLYHTDQSRSNNTEKGATRRTMDDFEIDSDEEYSESRNNPRSYKGGNKSILNKRRNHYEEDEGSLRSFKWKQPLGYTYSSNNFSCKSNCGGNCSKSGKCGKIRECIKKYEDKEAKKCKAILKKCCALGYSQINMSQQISPQSYREFDREQVETTNKEKNYGKRKGKDIEKEERSIRGNLQKELGQYQSKIKTNSTKDRKNRETIHPGSPEEEYEHDREVLTKNDWVVNIFEEESVENQSQEGSNKSKVPIKKETEFNRSRFQEKSDQYVEGSRRSSTSKRSTQEAYDKNGEESKKRNNAIKDGWLTQDELDRNPEDIRRINKGKEQSRNSFKDKDKVQSEPSQSFQTSEDKYPKDRMMYRREDKISAASPCSTRSMVELTTNIERDNTNRLFKNKMICQRPRCKGKCNKTVEFVECPYKNHNKKTDKEIVCYSPEHSPRPQQNCSKNRTCDSDHRSQPPHYQRAFSHHSLLELPLVYPHAIGKPRKMTKCERNNCKDVCSKGRKHFEDLIKQNKLSSNNSNKLNTAENQNPSTSIKRSELTENPSVYKDPIEENVQTDC